jgi:hypothetical protein
MAAALKLGETLVKCAFTAITGKDVVGDMATGLASVLGDKALSAAQSRKATRLLANIADTAAGQVAGAYEHEFRGLSESERAVVIEAVGETFAQVSATGSVLAADFDAKRFERQIRDLTGEYLRRRFFGQDEGELYGLILQRSCVEMIGIVRGLSDLANRAAPEVLSRLTALDRDVWEAPRRALAEAAQDKDSTFADLYREFVNDQAAATAQRRGLAPPSVQRRLTAHRPLMPKIVAEVRSLAGAVPSEGPHMLDHAVLDDRDQSATIQSDERTTLRALP